MMATGTHPTSPEMLSILEEVAQAAQKESLTPAERQITTDAFKTIADKLQSEQARTDIASTNLISSAAALLKKELLDASTGTSFLAIQLWRTFGNLCYDHDENRSSVLSANVPQITFEYLAEILGRLKDTPRWTSTELTEIRAAIGSLLNMSLKYGPVQAEIRKTENLAILLSLIDPGLCTVYTVGSWTSSFEGDGETLMSDVKIGSIIATWIITIIEDSLSEDKSTFPSAGIASLSRIILSTFPGPQKTFNSYSESKEAVSDFVDSDIELLTSAAGLLESLSIDLESAKQEIAFSNVGVFHHRMSKMVKKEETMLYQLLIFIQNATTPSVWPTSIDSTTQNEKAFANIKSAVVRAVVESPNSDIVMEKVFVNATLGESKKSWLIELLVKWLEANEREDLVICAAHMLAALARKDEYCVELAQRYDVVVPASKVVLLKSSQQMGNGSSESRPGEVTQVLYGVVSLLRHLSIPFANKQVLSETGLVEAVSQLLKSQLDVVSPLQNAVVGLLKHMTLSNVSSSLQVLGLHSSATSQSSLRQSTLDSTQHAQEARAAESPVDLILALVKRTDDVRLRSEATRILVNIVRTLFATRPIPQGGSESDLSVASPITPSSLSTAPSVDLQEGLKRRGRPRVVTPDVADALSEMVRLSEKYPMLINEGIVGLTLLAGSGAIGALSVLDAITNQHDSPNSAALSRIPSSASLSGKVSKPSSRASSLAVTVAGDPPTSMGMLSTWVGLCAQSKLSETGVRPEMVGNACALVITVIRGCQVAGVKTDADRLVGLRKKLLGPLTGAYETLGKEGGNVVLRKSVSSALEVVNSRS